MQSFQAFASIGVVAVSTGAATPARAPSSACWTRRWSCSPNAARTGSRCATSRPPPTPTWPASATTSARSGRSAARPPSRPSRACSTSSSRACRRSTTTPRSSRSRARSPRRSSSRCRTPSHPDRALLRIFDRTLSGPPGEMREWLEASLARVDAELMTRLARALPAVGEDELRFRWDCVDRHPARARRGHRRARTSRAAARPTSSGCSCRCSPARSPGAGSERLHKTFTGRVAQAPTMLRRCAVPGSPSSSCLPGAPPVMTPREKPPTARPALTGAQAHAARVRDVGRADADPGHRGDARAARLRRRRGARPGRAARSASATSRAASWARAPPRSRTAA